MIWVKLVVRHDASSSSTSSLHTYYYLTLHVSLRVFKFLMECYCGGTLGHPVRKCVYGRLFAAVPPLSELCWTKRYTCSEHKGRAVRKKMFCLREEHGRKPVLKQPASRTVKLILAEHIRDIF